jgi:hypothetical protein
LKKAGVKTAFPVEIGDRTNVPVLFHVKHFSGGTANLPDSTLYFQLFFGKSGLAVSRRRDNYTL